MLVNKWNQKKSSGNVLSKEEKNERDSWTNDDWMKHNFQEELENNREASIKNNISGKINAGGTLTPEEERYLEKNDPAALNRYRQAKMEKKAYEEKLKRCKTKDEVERLKTNEMSGMLASFKKIEHDPYIPISEKFAKAMEMLAKSRNMEEAEQKFKASAEYEELPTEAEINANNVEEIIEENEEIIEQTMEVLDEKENNAITDDNETGNVDEKTNNNLENNIDDKLIANKDIDNGNITVSKEKSYIILNDKDIDDIEKKKKQTVKVDYHKEIEQIYKRIELNSILEKQTETETVTAGNIINSGAGVSKNSNRSNNAKGHISIIV